MQDLDGRFDWTSGLTTLQDAIDRHPLIVAPDAAVLHVAEQMKQRSSCALIQAGQKLLGIVTERDIVRLTAKGLYLRQTPVLEVMARNLITLQWSELQNPCAVLTLFQRHQIRHLPILDQQGELIGLLTPQILRQTMQSSDLLQLRRVADVMTTRVITAPPLTKVIALAQLMVNHRVSCVVIVEPQRSTHPSEPSQAASDQAPLGIVTERDIVKFQSQQFDLYNLTAQQVMSAPLNCVSPDDTLWASHQAMNHLQVRRLVVTHGERLSGIITQTSILSALNPVELYDTVQVLQAEVERLQDERLLHSENQSLALNEQVKEGERRFRAIFNNTFQFTGLMKLDGTLIEANQTALAFGGLQREDVIGLPVWETYWWTISPETQAQLREATERAAQGEFIRYEVDVLGVGSQVVTIDFSLRPLKDEQGNVVLLIPEGRDISDRKRAEEALRCQIEFDRLVANIANRFIALPSEELDSGIRRSLQEIGEFTGVETSYVFQFSADQSSLSMSHEWVAPGFPPQLAHVQDVPVAAFPWGCEKLRCGEVLHLPDLDQLPAEAAVDRQSCQQFNLKSILAIPLRYQEEVFGWVGFASFTQEQHWSEDSIRLLNIFGATLTQVLQRQKSEQALRQSEQRFESLAKIAPVGISKSDAEGNCLYFNERALVPLGEVLENCS